MQSTITYEQPLNERVRSFLRLELLFQQVRHSLRGPSAFDSRTTFSYLMDILTLFGRSDLKTEVLKELERQSVNLARMTEHPGVDRTRLVDILKEQEQLTERVHAMQGQIGQELRENEFINSVRQRTSIPGGTCDFDVPIYHFWLQRDSEERITDLARWLSEFEPIEDAIQVILALIRESATTRNQSAESGFFQQSLDTTLPYQMIRIHLPHDSPYFPEVSAGKHRYTVRFLTPVAGERPVQASEDVTFRLACCVL